MIGIINPSVFIFDLLLVLSSSLLISRIVLLLLNYLCRFAEFDFLGSSADFIMNGDPVSTSSRVPPKLYICDSYFRLAGELLVLID